jgi:hypothetical protein
LESKVAALQFSLMKRDIQLRKTGGRQTVPHERLGEVIQDVVKAKARLESSHAKADAASSLAEAEVALTDLKRRVGKEKPPALLQAEHLIEMSSQAFGEQNYSGSLYLSIQTKSLLKLAEVQMATRDKEPVPFVLPFSLRVLKKSNVREGPGLEFKVLFTLDRESSVMGVAYKNEWVQVEAEDRRKGWIFYSLLEVSGSRG